MEEYIPLIERALIDEPEIKSFTTQTDGNSIRVNVDLLDKAERKNE
jgi:hypothetical protein